MRMRRMNFLNGTKPKVKYRDGGYKKYTYDEYDNFQMSVFVLYNKNQAVGNK